MAAILKNREPSKLLFAYIPIVFGVQQISEGFVWLALQSSGHDMVLKLAVYTFLTMALVVWPTMIPLSVLLMERSKKRRRGLYVFLTVGIAVSLCYGMALLFLKVTARISSYHILYIIEFPHQLARIVALIFYLIATIPPLFISSVRRMKLFGIVMVLSYSLTLIFYREYLISIWCFLAALASLVIWWIVIDRRGQNSRAQQPNTENCSE